jgi:hypothetical protein
MSDNTVPQAASDMYARFAVADGEFAILTRAEYNALLSCGAALKLCAAVIDDGFESIPIGQYLEARDAARAALAEAKKAGMA